MPTYHKKTSVAGEFAKPNEDFRDKDTVTLKNAGSEVEGKFGPQTVFKILCATGEKNVAFNQTSINNMVDVFGEDGDKWVDQKIRVHLIPQMVQGKRSLVKYFAHPDWDWNEDGILAPPLGAQNAPERDVDVDYDAI